MGTESDSKSWLGVTLTAIAGLLLVTVLVLAVLVAAVPLATGGKSLCVYNNAMSPTFKSGDMIVIRGVGDPSQISEGQIVTFRVSPDSSTLFTLRIVGEDGEHDARRFIMQGDAQGTTEAITVNPDQIIGLYMYRVPVVGSLVSWAEEHGLVLIAVLLALVVLLLVALLISVRRRPAQPRPKRSEGQLPAADAAPPLPEPAPRSPMRQPSRSAPPLEEPVPRPTRVEEGGPVRGTILAESATPPLPPVRPVPPTRRAARAAMAAAADTGPLGQVLPAAEAHTSQGQLEERAAWSTAGQPAATQTSDGPGVAGGVASTGPVPQAQPAMRRPHAPARRPISPQARIQIPDLGVTGEHRPVGRPRPAADTAPEASSQRPLPPVARPPEPATVTPEAASPPATAPVPAPTAGPTPAAEQLPAAPPPPPPAPPQPSPRSTPVATPRRPTALPLANRPTAAEAPSNGVRTGPSSASTGRESHRWNDILQSAKAQADRTDNRVSTRPDTVAKPVAFVPRGPGVEGVSTGELPLRRPQSLKPASSLAALVPHAVTPARQAPAQFEQEEEPPPPAPVAEPRSGGIAARIPRAQTPARPRPAPEEPPMIGEEGPGEPRREPISGAWATVSGFEEVEPAPPLPQPIEPRPTRRYY